MTEVIVRGTVDQRAVEQMQRCADAGDAVAAAICADGHVGYSQPIGGVVAYRDYVSPSGVGYDIGCGNKAVLTDLRRMDLEWFPGGISGIMDEIVNRVSFGMGRNNDEPVEHPVIEAIAQADFTPQQKLAPLAAKQLGTVGSGNHYVDLFADEDDRVWIGVHFGSRGFGHKTASGFLSMAQGNQFDQHGKDGEMDSPPVLFHVGSDIGQSYIAAMQLAGEYAYAGRDVVCAKVLEILGACEVSSVHNHHNFVWLEEHGGELVWVIRKGCTPAFPGQYGFVGATMAEESVVLRGLQSDAGAPLLYSTVHGAGRVMSRTQAAGKTKRRKVWECSDRDCDYRVPSFGQPETYPCPEHLENRLIKRWTTEQVRAGAIDWDDVRLDLKDRGIQLRGGGADEAPGAYKRLREVLEAHSDTIEVVHRLRPLGVAMAGRDVYDAYKD